VISSTRKECDDDQHFAEQMLEIRGEDVLEKSFRGIAQRVCRQLERLLEELKSSRKDSIERQVIVNLEGKSCPC